MKKINEYDSSVVTADDTLRSVLVSAASLLFAVVAVALLAQQRFFGGWAQ